MASIMDSKVMILASQWASASVQLTDFVKTIKLSMMAFNRLGLDGEDYFKRQATLMLMKPAEFIYDESNPNRVYFGNPDDVQKETNGFLYLYPAMRLPVLRPGRGDHHSFDATFGASRNDIPNHTMVLGHAGEYGNQPGQPRQSFHVFGCDPTQLQLASSHNTDQKVKKPINSGVVKQPPNGYLRFRTYYSEELRRENPGMHQRIVSGKAKNKWRGMTLEEQEPWLTAARKEMEGFKAQHPNFFKERAAQTMKHKQLASQEEQSQAKRQRMIYQQPGQSHATALHHPNEQAAYRAPSSSQQPQRQVHPGSEQMTHHDRISTLQLQEPLYPGSGQMTHQGPLHLGSEKLTNPEQMTHQYPFSMQHGPSAEGQNNDVGGVRVQEDYLSHLIGEAVDLISLDLPSSILDDWEFEYLFG
ncbi:hypothetical protein GGR51DRAFT_578512 [Nemania sp. FL0031]|nr:hypothetical protein GGR51DRAFT_578512 [Nemania sp. FL0031]